MGLDRAQLIETVVQGVEERLVPGASGFIPDPPPSLPDPPEVPRVPATPDPSGWMPQTPGMPRTPGIPQAPGLSDLPQAPGIPGAAQNGLDQLDRARGLGDQLHPDTRNPGSEHAAHREVGADGFADLIETEDEPERERQPFAEDEEHATAVLRVCRNGWNVVDTRAVGGHWFSA